MTDTRMIATISEGEIQAALRTEMHKLHAYAMECKPGPGEFTARDYAGEIGLTYDQAMRELDAMLLAGRVMMRNPNRSKIYKFSEPGV